MRLAQVRRLALAGQDLLASPRRPAGTGETLEVVRRLGFVQVDSINVVERAHHLILHSRNDGYRPAHLEHLLEVERSLFEHWTHDASVIPTEWFGHWRHRFERFEERMAGRAWWQERRGTDPSALEREVLERIGEEGPLPTRAFRHRGTHSGTWWGWGPAKAALEHLWRTGRLMISRRDGFEKVYDLTERVIPAEALAQRPAWEDTVAWACREAIDRLGAATASEVASFWRIASKEQAERWCRDHLERVRVEGRELYLRPEAARVLEAASAPPSRLRLLAPFDPLVRDRKRLAWLFGFDYRFEAFVPAPDRRYGYYVFPVLERERLVARVDLKLDRRGGKLLTLGAWWEPGAHSRGRERRLEEAVERLARWLLKAPSGTSRSSRRRSSPGEPTSRRPRRRR